MSSDKWLQEIYGCNSSLSCIYSPSLCHCRNPSVHGCIKLRLRDTEICNSL